MLRSLVGSEMCIRDSIKTQLAEEKPTALKIDKETLVAECFLVKNIMISVAGCSPYQAVYGRVPPILTEFEPASETQLDDTSGGVSGISRHHHRLREISVQAMVQMTASQRLDRAMKSNTRPSGQQLDLQINDSVDFYRPPATKDESGWRGPARVVEVGPPALIQWQGQVIQVRTQDVRRALHYFMFDTICLLYTSPSPRDS